MATVALQDLIDRTRTESGLRNNPYYTDAKLIDYLNAGGSELYDLFTATNQKYVISTYDFTVTGPSDAVVALPDDFQQGHSLDIYPDTAQVRTVRYLSNWLDRNAQAGNASFYLGGRDPVYTFLGNDLHFYPANAIQAASYRLYYVPQWVNLAAPITVSWDLAAAANVTDNSGTNQYNFGSSPGDHPTFVDAMSGGTLTVFFMTPNSDWACTDAVITGPDPFSNGNSATTGVTWPGGSFTSPVVDGTASITYQPAGTQPELPSVMGPWSEYLVVYAAIAVNIDRQRPHSDLDAKLERLKARVLSVLTPRQEEPQQPPLSRGGGVWLDGWWV